MNTNPDDTTLALWLEDELEGDELAAMEAACADKPELLAQRAEHRAWKEWITRCVPCGEEPPYGEFFNARVLRGIARDREEQESAPAKPAGGFAWRMWFMPAAAAAGMVLAFQIGARTRPVASDVVQIDVSNAPRAIIVEPILYTPEKGVKARWFNSPEADAFVIVLDGVPAIPDSVDFDKALSQADGKEEERAMADVVVPDHAEAGGGS